MLKKILYKITAVCCLILVCFFTNMQSVYAENINITVDDNGIKAEPAGGNLFYEDNLNPGDDVNSHINVKNNYGYPVDVYMKTARTGNVSSNETADLYKKLVLTVSCDGNEIYSGTMNGFDGKDICIGRLQSGDKKDITAYVSLPKETDNSYQDKVTQSKWIFSATPVMTSAGNMPKTGEAAYLVLYFASAALIASGIVLSKKRK